MNGAQLIAVERTRQIEMEGLTAAHDKQGLHRELAHAASLYIKAALHDPAQRHSPALLTPPKTWPWDKTWWKPTSAKRDLIKAGALIAAAIDQMDREELAAKIKTEGCKPTKCFLVDHCATCGRDETTMHLCPNALQKKEGEA